MLTSTRDNLHGLTIFTRQSSRLYTITTEYGAGERKSMLFRNQRASEGRGSELARHLYSKIMLFSGAKPTQALIMFSSIALCFASAFTTGVPGGTRGALVR